MTTAENTCPEGNPDKQRARAVIDAYLGREESTATTMALLYGLIYVPLTLLLGNTVGLGQLIFGVVVFGGASMLADHSRWKENSYLLGLLATASVAAAVIAALLS
ncbi:hypothetical protein AB0E67_35625 [Streptomyces sp. NPDC032161]|uniref:hypothetical protein n=1 Tax=unclassified Streptomyces TaxID=2593676 RepID=UPI0033ED93FA